MTLDQALITFLLMLVAQVPILVTAAVAYLKSRAAIDNNTELTKLTKQGTETASKNAKIAATAANDAKVAATESTNNLAEQLNGKLDNTISTIVKAQLKPVIDSMQDHAITDEKNMREMREIRDALAGLKK